MQGAGHNFGIVTSFELKIYPKNLETWHYHNYIFTQDNLETFFRALNAFHDDGNTPVLMGMNMGGFLMNTSISKTEVCWTRSPMSVFHCHMLTSIRPSLIGHSATLDQQKTQKPFSNRSMTSAHTGMGPVTFPSLTSLKPWALAPTKQCAFLTRRISSQQRHSRRGT